MSYRKKHVKSKVNRIKPKRHIFTRLWFWVVILILAIISACIYFLIMYPKVQVENIVVSGNKKIATKDIESFVSKEIKKKIIKIGNWEINSKSIFLINSQKLREDMQKEFPMVASMQIDRKFMQTLQISATERTAVAIFCSTADRSTKSCYFIDKNGVAFELDNMTTAGLFIVRQKANVGQISMGQSVVDKKVMDLLLKAEKNIKDNFKIGLMTATIASSARLDVKTSEGWNIYFDLGSGSDADSQIVKLNLLLNKISPDGRKSLRYIDLRPKDRAIVCDNSTCGG